MRTTNVFLACVILALGLFVVIVDLFLGGWKLSDGAIRSLNNLSIILLAIIAGNAMMPPK